MCKQANSLYFIANVAKKLNKYGKKLISQTSKGLSRGVTHGVHGRGQGHGDYYRLVYYHLCKTSGHNGYMLP